MFRKMDLLRLWAGKKWDEWMDWMLHEEKGASDIVAIMVVIVILLAVAVIFKEQLTTLVTNVFEKASQWVENN